MRSNELGLVLGSCCLAIACGSTAAKGAADSQNGPDTTGVTPCRAAVGPDATLTVDDFEDGDLQLDETNNLRGSWYVTNDGTGQQSPMPGAENEGLVDGAGSPESPAHALHTSGSGFTRWGAFAAARLNASNGQACAYDLSRYAGLHLSIQGAGSLRVNLGTAATTPVVDGGDCNAEACSDYGKSLLLDAEWQSVDVPFEQLAQPDWANAAPLELAKALRISFWAEREDFEFGVDDLQFYR